MWFKNIQVYQLSPEFKVTPEELETGMETKAFQPCGQMDLLTSGWEKPLGRKGSSLIHETNQYVMICFKQQEKLLPASVINELLAEKVEEIVEAEGRKIGRKEKQQMKDELIIDLLPKAFSRSKKLFAYIDLKNNLLMVDSPAAKKAEDLITLMRESLGSFPAKPLAVKNTVPTLLTAWAQGDKDKLIEIGNEAELRDEQDSAIVVRCKGLSLSDDEVQNHIKNKMYISQIAIEWSERINCLLTEDLVIKRIKFTDAVQEEADNQSTDDYASKFDADFAIMSGEFNQFLPWLFAAFGGVA